MRRIVVAAVVMLACGAPATAGTHVRPLTAGAAGLVDDAMARSVIVAWEIDALERTDVVVYVSDGYDGPPGGPAAGLTWWSSAGGRRYLLVQVSPWNTMPVERIAWLGHELQHALEVAAAPEVVDARTLAALYHRIGWETDTGHFETDAAHDIGNLVRDELAGFPTDPSAALRH